MNHINHLLTSQIFIKQFASIVKEQKSARQWQTMIDHAQPFENEATKTLRGFFNEQKEEAVKNLYGYKSFTKAVDAEQSCDWEYWKIQFAEFEQLLLPEIFAEWGQEVLNTLTLGIMFNPDVPQIDEFINAYSYKMAVNVNDTTKRQIQDLFKQALDEGNSVPQIEKKLRSMFTDISKVRANMIARSEVIRAHNAAADASYIQSGVVEKKRWWTARDERRCFAENTQIETEQGLKQIKDIKVGDMVQTHKGMKKVVNVSITKKTGRMIKMYFSTKQSLVCTPDHPIYESNRGWQYAEELNIGDKLQTSENEIIEVANLHNIKFFKAYNYISKFFKGFIPLCIFNWIIVPILAICFETDIEGRQKEINAVGFNLKFLGKFNFKSFKRLSDDFFKFCFPRIRTIAMKRTESLSFLLRRAYLKILSTFEAVDKGNLLMATFLRTIMSCIAFSIKNFSACRTNSDSLEAMPTFQAANSVSVSGLFGNREILITNRTMLDDHKGLTGVSITSIRTKSSATLDLTLSLIRRFSTIFANNFNAFFHKINLCRYYNKYIRWCQAYNVYDIEVEDAHTYFAGGVLVHNCPWCAEMHGKEILVSETYFNLGDRLTVVDDKGKPHTLKFDYSEIRYPPIHIRCRCVLLPIIFDVYR